MVREVRLGWDADRPVPPEISRQDWDCDDPGIDRALPHVQRRRKRRVAKVPGATKSGAPPSLNRTADRRGDPRHDR
ncbi:hypothetical protein [Planctomicrobium sp. SH664]|uniref:hypothetical protein n=1 Tax=Planctomicrobium sp. SH664 TaxID=3448125 RepID=UPI003F5BFA11